MKLDQRTIRLIAVGASISANCQPCLEINVSKALEYGASEQEVTDAIEVGKMVRTGAASKMDQFSNHLKELINSSRSEQNAGCECDAFASTITGCKNE